MHVPPDFSKLEIVVAAAARKRAALEKMLKVLSSKNFDKEDADAVKILLNSVLEEQKNATCELTKRRQLYETTLKAAQIQIHERSEAMDSLNDECEAFDLFPELAERFAKRQAVMQQKVEAAKKTLETLE